MILASSASGLAGFLIIAGLIGWALSLWLFVLMVTFLRSGRKAFDLYIRDNRVKVHQGPPPPGWSA